MERAAMATKRDPECSVGELELPGRRRSRLVSLRDDAHGVRVAVAPAAGGEIASMRTRIRGRWRELLYRALDYQNAPPDGFNGRAPLLWPAVGRFHTIEQIERWRVTGRKPKALRYRARGRVYSMRIHGFARDMPWALDDCGADGDSAWATCSLRNSAETQKIYPFKFGLKVTHTLRDGAVISRYEVEAGDNDIEMPFCIGNHISFRLPFTHKGSYDACMIRTPGRRRMRVNELSLTDDQQTPVDLSEAVPLSSGVYDDTVITGYRRRNSWAEVIDPESLRVKITQAEKRVRGRFTGREQDTIFVFWGKPQYDQLCPEPWMGWLNGLNTGKGVLTLAPGARFIWELRVEFAAP